MNTSINRCYPGQQVVICRANYGVPKGRRGMVLYEDHGDTDFPTYTVRFGKIVIPEVRVYHLKAILKE